MPRKSIGDAAKKRVVAVRVTEAEHNALVRKYGTPTRALRAFITATVKER